MAQIQLTDEFNSQGGVGGTCYLCNASKRIGIAADRIITTNLEVDYDAEPGVWPVKWLEFCETCVKEMGHLLGMFDESAKDDLVSALNYRDEVIKDLTDEVDQLKAEIKAFGLLQKYVSTPERVAGRK